MRLVASCWFLCLHHKWNLCGDLKVVVLLLGMQLGHTNYCCLLHKWDTRDKKNHYINKLWPKRTSLTPGEPVNPLLVLPEKIYLSSLHIKLGLMKNFMKGMDRTGRGFEYMRNKFPNVSDANVKEGIFIGPQIRELMQDKQFYEDMNEIERNAWLSFKRICKDFLGNHKAVNYQDVVQDLLTSYKAMECNMSLKIHFLETHLNFFPRKSRRNQYEHGESFHQDIMAIKKPYQGKLASSILADHCWTLKRDVPDAKYRRKSYASTF